MQLDEKESWKEQAPQVAGADCQDFSTRPSDSAEIIETGMDIDDTFTYNPISDLWIPDFSNWDMEQYSRDAVPEIDRSWQQCQDATSSNEVENQQWDTSTLDAIGYRFPVAQGF
jgi:hypothetical protein